MGRGEYRPEPDVTKDWAPLTDVETISGTAQDPDGSFRGFVTVRALAEDGSHMAGQLDPGTLREMALHFLETAEAAEQDAIVFTMMTRDMDLDAAVAARFVANMRAERGKNIGPREQG